MLRIGSPPALPWAATRARNCGIPLVLNSVAKRVALLHVQRNGDCRAPRVAGSINSSNATSNPASISVWHYGFLSKIQVCGALRGTAAAGIESNVSLLAGATHNTR
jgi:hypothetical protein